MSWPHLTADLDGFDAESLEQLLEERIAQGFTSSIDRDLRDLCGGWTVALDWSPQVACRAGVGAQTVVRALDRLYELLTELAAVYEDNPLPEQGREETLGAVLRLSWRLVARLDATPDRFVDAICWYFDAMDQPLPDELERELATLILEGLLDSEPAVLVKEVTTYTLHSLDGEA